eukprot:6181327-Pleurochrysis_carterae.AAC.1
MCGFSLRKSAATKETTKASPVPRERTSAAPRSMTTTSARPCMSRHGTASSIPLSASSTPTTLCGNAARAPIIERPKKRARQILTRPISAIDEPVRAPKACCAASPPQPWHEGKWPNQTVEMSMKPTDMAMRLAGTELGRRHHRVEKSHRQLRQRGAVQGDPPVIPDHRRDGGHRRAELHRERRARECSTDAAKADQDQAGGAAPPPVAHKRDGRRDEAAEHPVKVERAAPPSLGLCYQPHARTKNFESKPELQAANAGERDPALDRGD